MTGCSFYDWLRLECEYSHMQRLLVACIATAVAVAIALVLIRRF